MFDSNTLLPPRVVREFIPTYDSNINHWRQLADENDDMAVVLPGKPSATGKARMFTPLQAALAALMSDFMLAGLKAPLAARIARRIMEGHRQRPEVDQWAIVVTANGNVSTLPYDETELRSGFISGARLAFAVAIDLQNYGERVAAAIQAATVIAGGDQDA